MSFVSLPDGSRICGFSGVGPGARLRDTSDSFGFMSDLHGLRQDFIAMTQLRQLVAREGDGSGGGPVGEDSLLSEVSRLLQSGRLRWVLPGSDGAGHSEVRGLALGPTAPAEAPAPPPPKPLPPKPQPAVAPMATKPASKPTPPQEQVLVTPELKVEYKVVLFDRDLNKHLSKSETKANVSGTTIEVSYKQAKPDPKFSKGLQLKVSGTGVVEVYEDEKLSKKLDLKKPISNSKLKSPLKLWLYGTTKGKFDLTLEVEAGDDRFKADKPAVEKMGVVELKMVPHEPDQDKLDALEVDPDTDPVDKYYTDLKDKDLPEQKELTDERKIKVGRMLHVQKDGHFGRAKLVVKKLEAAQWPDGTDDYTLVFSGSKSADASDSNAFKIFDKEFDGTEKPMPAALKVTDLKAADATLWLEATEASKKLLDLRLDLGVDRPAGGLDKAVKRFGDWAQFSVLKIKEVKLDYTPPKGKPDAWDDAKSQFSINFQDDPDGRKVKIKATLSEKFKGIPIRFMLAAGKDNLKAGNWGVALPGTWKWKDITANVKHKDRADRKKVLTQKEVTDEKGVATAELTLSRFGGDKFRPSCYLDCDPHLAKYIDGHADLQKRKPVQADKDIIVWRKFWYQVVKVEGMNPPAMAGAEGQYTRVKADMKLTTELAVARSKVNKFNPKAIYPKYMVIVNGGNADALLVSDTNKAQFFTGYKAEKDKPIKIPILICDAQWDPGPDTAPKDAEARASAFPLDVPTDKLVLIPPLQGGNLLVGGTWTAAEWDPAANAGAGDWVNVRTGSLTNANLSINPARATRKTVTVALPAVGATTARTKVWIENLVVQGANGPYLGEYSSGEKRILAVYDPNQQVDFQNTIAHEIGHAFRQVAKPGNIAAGIPAHPNQYDKQGSHCSVDTNKCVMYESGPIAGSYNRFCDTCHPYLLVNDMKSLS